MLAGIDEVLELDLEWLSGAEGSAGVLVWEWSGVQ